MSGIKLASGFDLSSPVPLDSRQVVATLAARDAIPMGVRYEGMNIYVKSEKKQFLLKGGIDNSNFVEAGNSEATQELAIQVADVEQNKAEKSYVDYNLSTLDTKINSQASGSPKAVYPTISALQAAFPTGNSNIYLVTGNVKEVASLTISAVATIAGNITINLNGVATNIALDPAVETTTALIASKIRNTIFPNGVVTGGTDSTVTFTASSSGVKTDATYSAGSTGATGVMTTITQGVEPDGKWYYWNGSAWTPGGVYQSSGLADGSIDQFKFAINAINPSVIPFFKKPNNLFNKNTTIMGYTIDRDNGQLVPNIYFRVSDFIPVKPNQPYIHNGTRYALYDKSYNFISSLSLHAFTTTNNTYFARIVSNYNAVDTQLNEGTKLLPYDEFKYVLTSSNENPIEIDSTLIPNGTGSEESGSDLGEQYIYNESSVYTPGQSKTICNVSSKSIVDLIEFSANNINAELQIYYKLNDGTEFLYDLVTNNGFESVPFTLANLQLYGSSIIEFIDFDDRNNVYKVCAKSLTFANGFKVMAKNNHSANANLAVRVVSRQYA